MKNEDIYFLIPELGLNLKRIEIIRSHAIRDLHFHNAVEIVRVEEGMIGTVVGEKELILKKGDTLIINKKTTHKLYFYKEKAIVTYLQIDIDRYGGFREKDIYMLSFKNENLPYKLYDINSDVNMLFDDITEEIKNKKTYYTDYIKSDLFRIYAVMAREGFFTDNVLFENGRECKKILPVLEYLNENTGEKIYLEYVCSILNVDKFYFCKLFKKIMGMTFVEYVNFIRLKKAEDLLLNTDKNISEISYECGFASIQYFNKLFKLNRKCTPKEFRNMNIRIY